MRWGFLLVCLLVGSAVAQEGLEITDADDDEYETVDLQAKQAEQASTNPCNQHKCERGETCVLEDSGEPVCVCRTCDSDPDDIQVCSTKNVTYASECHLDRDHCLCHRQQPGCQRAGVDKIRLDYFTACKELSQCPENEFEEFPQRMQDWLFRIMRDMVNKEDDFGSEQYMELLAEARHDEHHAAAVLWKFCALDIHPLDRKVTRRELMYIIASIKPMEHCLVPFLNGCDTNNDNTIDLVEWGTCLGISHEKIQVQCDVVHQSRG